MRRFRGHAGVGMRGQGHIYPASSEAPADLTERASSLLALPSLITTLCFDFLTDLIGQWDFTKAEDPASSEEHLHAIVA